MPAVNVTSFAELFGALDFDRPLDVDNPADERLYVRGLHDSCGFNPVDELRGNIQGSKQPGTWLFTGHRGVGKSTELRRMAHELRQQGHLVIVADMGEYLSLAEPIGSELLLLTAVAALADGVEEKLGGNHLSQTYGQRLWHWLTTTEVLVKSVDAQLPLGDAKISFKTEFKDNRNFRDQVLKAVAAAPAKLHTQAREFVKTIADDVAHSDRYGPGKKVVLVLDSLEKLRVSGSNAAESYEAIQRTFDTQAEFLRLGSIDVVYSVPPYLPFLTPKIGSYFNVEVVNLPHAKVFNRPPAGTADTPVQPNGEGIARVVDTARRRIPNIEAWLPLPALERLALDSSGSIRDFFRLLRSVAAKARTMGQPAPLANTLVVEMAEDALRDEMRVSREDRSWLRQVRQTQGDGLETMADLPRMAQLFDGGLILSSRNGREWCDVHYLLHDELRQTDLPRAS